MKILVSLVICLLSIHSVLAQFSFRPAVRAGANFSKFTQTESSFKTDFYVGLAAEFNFSKFYSLQPELTYSQQGANDIPTRLIYFNEETQQQIEEKSKLDIAVSYISFAIINKLNVTERFHIYLGPGLDIETGKSIYTDVPLDFTMNLGVEVGLLDNLFLEGRIKKGLINILEGDEVHLDTSYSDKIGRYNSALVFQVGLIYKFDMAQND